MVIGTLLASHLAAVKLIEMTMANKLLFLRIRKKHEYFLTKKLPLFNSVSQQVSEYMRSMVAFY